MRKAILLILIVTISIVFVSCGSADVAKEIYTPVLDDSQQKITENSKQEKPTANTEPAIKATKSENYSAFVSNDFHPIVFMNIDENGLSSPAAYALGGYKEGKWYNLSDFDVELNEKKISFTEFAQGAMEQENASIDLIKGGEFFKFYSDKEYVTQQQCQKPKLYISESCGEVMLSVPFEPFRADKLTDHSYLIGVNGQWNALPRAQKILDNNTLSVDIDNDGKQELLKLLEKPRMEEGFTSAKDVELVMVKDGKDITIEKEILLEVESGADYDFLTLDLNGDGAMEIVTITNNFFEYTVRVCQLINDKPYFVSGYFDGE